jgi:hypothetical protein
LLLRESIFKNFFKKKEVQTVNRQDRPGHRFFPVLAVFFGSLADRFSAPIGPNAGPIPGSTGPTSRSGSDNLKIYNMN